MEGLFNHHQFDGPIKWWRSFLGIIQPIDFLVEEFFRHHQSDGPISGGVV